MSWSLSAKSQSQITLENICRKWKVSKVMIDGQKSIMPVINDRLNFSSNNLFHSFDSGDKTGKSSIRGTWTFDKTGKFILQNKGSENENQLKILKLNNRNFVYQLVMNRSVWEVHMKAAED